MKKIVYILGLVALVISSGCEKETEGISFETNYATFELTGENPMSIPLGNAYNEPGVKALAGDVELDVESSNNIDPSKVGVYTVNYAAVNPDGFSASTFRTVVVYAPDAPATDISGSFVSDMFRTSIGGVFQREFKGLSVDVAKVGPGVFYISDFLGGYYAQGIGYGAAYAMTGYVALNTDNTLTLLSSHISGWGDSLDRLDEGKYNPSAGTITWKSVYVSSYIFHVTLK